MDLNQIKQMDSNTLKERIDQIEYRLREFSDVDLWSRPKEFWDLKKECYLMLLNEQLERLKVMFYDFVALRKLYDKRKKELLKYEELNKYRNALLIYPLVQPEKT